jgi:predicted nucleic acid-binding protein
MGNRKEFATKFMICFISSVKPYIDQMMDYNFRISDELYERILFDAGEL